MTIHSVTVCHATCVWSANIVKAAAYESEAAKCPQRAQYARCATYQQTLFATGQPDVGIVQCG
jgi:hypothetical protein